MIVCSCAVLTDDDIAGAIGRIFERDPYAVITPGRVYHLLDKRMDCHGCRDTVDRVIEAAVRAHIDALS